MYIITRIVCHTRACLAPGMHDCALIISKEKLELLRSSLDTYILLRCL
jgi:hypothetical protein